MQGKFAYLHELENASKGKCKENATKETIKLHAVVKTMQNMGSKISLNTQTCTLCAYVLIIEKMEYLFIPIQLRQSKT